MSPRVVYTCRACRRGFDVVPFFEPAESVCPGCSAELATAVRARGERLERLATKLAELMTTPAEAPTGTGAMYRTDALSACFQLKRPAWDTCDGCWAPIRRTTYRPIAGLYCDEECEREHRDGVRLLLDEMLATLP